MGKYFKLFIIILFSVWNISCYSSFMVTKTSFGVDLNRPMTQETALINQGNKVVRVRVDFEKPKWAKDKYYLGDQLVVYPKIVLIPPKSKIHVKIAPRIKRDLEDGEYVALLVFKELPLRNNNNQVSLLMNIGIPYYGRKGELRTGIEFKKFRVIKVKTGYKLQGNVMNIGNFSYSLNVKVKFYKEKKLIGEKTFKQGFYRDKLLEIKESIPLDRKADYAEVTFENEKFNFSKGLTFEL
ncbi:MAG: hypothetical protein WBG30_07760 [Psychrilyobacter sp.]|uniref:hypothetical protein n=1 Tax=Psychrilyobacter sp. TaxID=2586924 RepID=UPI003C734763